MIKRSLLRENLPQTLLFELTPQHALKFFLGAIGILAIASLGVQFGFYYLPEYPSKTILSGLFFVDHESNIPTMYSVLTLILCSMILGFIANAKKAIRGAYINYWMTLSVIFLFLAIDEFASLHEKLIEPIHSKLNTSGFFYFAWVIPGAAFTFVCLLIFTRFLSHLPTQTRRLFLLAGSLYVSGTLGMEMIGGYYSSLINDRNNIIYAVIVTIEESLEMLGIAVFIYSLLHYISYYMKGTGLRINIVASEKKRRSA
ncbi:hypothetical protein H6G17_12315 [Chroococcidiopsis sp. FACHB-1243]|uniref:hypothetical protein n=1 Tax=Chroococcidiopsis sp. [FACHB-1243] TaxID=2692781 RepID=UPI00177CDD7B|nr:hypothetical protein [Chroococcidiopsis sp. [FACHB-1243]]MBD2306296.1 hypothetical protein [Chroococcidiopsis sp. [FACHB-1243]]